MKQIVFEEVNDCNLTHIFECGQCFRWNKAEESYIGVVGRYACRAHIIDTSGALVLEVSGGDEAFWRNYFDLDTDYSRIKQSLVESDPLIADACEYGRGIRILNQDVFETIISFIISQNNNIPRIKKNIESICRKYGEPLGELWGEERYAFPAAEVLANADVDALAEMKLGYRSEYIVRAARRYLEEGAPADYESVLDYYGIGPKVANCIMLFGLHSVDAFPVDTWVKQIMNDMYGFETADVKGMSRFAEERFGKYAGYAQQYLFYYYRDRR